MPSPSQKRKSPATKKPASTRSTTVKSKKPTRTPVTKRAAPVVPRPPRRAVFIDVENTSSEVDLMRVIEALQIDRVAQSTELTAVGNWRSVGQRLGRRLASLGAHLIHSAPAIGVRDWSDLWIAVAAGCWLGMASAGDTIEIVSDDKAFDAVGDAAAARGVTFRRISYRTMAGASEPATTTASPAPRRRRSRHGRRPTPGRAPTSPRTVGHAPAGAPTLGASASVTEAQAGEEAHAASHEQIISVVHRLTGGHPERWINLDVLANTLKAEGFTRPPGSPRLVTRLRKLKDLEISPNGMVRLIGPVRASTEEATAESAAPRRRTRRRGGRGRRRSERPADTAAESLSSAGE